MSQNSFEMSFKKFSDLSVSQILDEAKEVFGYLSAIRETAIERGQCVAELDLRIRQMKHILELFEDSLKP